MAQPFAKKLLVVGGSGFLGKNLVIVTIARLLKHFLFDRFEYLQTCRKQGLGNCQFKVSFHINNLIEYRIKTHSITVSQSTWRARDL
jgi:dTDP-D-glucose 4,6-dehydratase